MNGFGHIGLTFKSVPVSVLNEFVIPQSELETRLQQIKAVTGWSELIYLATCNRIEFYFHSHQHNHAVYQDFVSYWAPNLDEKRKNEFAKHLEISSGRETVNHILRVATSLDSMVIGETQILKQVKDSHQQSISFGLSGRYMNFLVRAVVECSKKAYSQTGISTNPVSVASMTYRSIKEHSRQSSVVTIIGAGDVVQSMLPYLIKQKQFHFHFVNRTEAKAKKLSETYGGTFQSLSDFQENPINCDVLISSTRADHVVVTRDIYGKLPNKKRLLIDLANPKDIDPAIGEIADVKLISLEHIEKLAEENNKIRREETKKVEAIIELSIEEFHQTLISRKIDSVFSELPDEVEAIKKKAVEKIIRTKLKHLTSDDQKVIHEFADYLSEKFLQVPMITAKKILIEQIEDDK